MTTMKAIEQETKLAVMAEQINTININVSAINKKLDSNYVTCEKLMLYDERVSRLEKIVYGVVAVVGTSILIAIIKLVILE